MASSIGGRSGSVVASTGGPVHSQYGGGGAGSLLGGATGLGGGGGGGAQSFFPRGGVRLGPSPLSTPHQFGGDGSSVAGMDASDCDEEDGSMLGGGGGGWGPIGPGGVGRGDGQGGGQNAWALRGDWTARDKAYRRARAEMKRFTATRKFPLSVGVVQVHSLGKVRQARSFAVCSRRVLACCLLTFVYVGLFMYAYWT